MAVAAHGHQQRLVDRRQGAARVVALVGGDQGPSECLRRGCDQLPIVLGTGIPYVYWLLTGKGPWRRYGLSSSVVVNLFPRTPPADIREALAGFSKAPISAA
jgi:hypothetical protein